MRSIPSLRLAALSFFAFSGIAATAPARLDASQTLSTYFVGNSLTGLINPASLQGVIAPRGDTLNYGYTIRTGASLSTIWANPQGQFDVDPYGYYDTALANYTWDSISLEPFSQTIDGAAGDRISVSNFINYARQASPNAQFYLYQSWPTVQDNVPFNFNSQWLSPYSGQNDATVRSRDYFQQLLNVSRQDFSGLSKPILMVPVGDVMYELNQRMHAGLIPGYTDISQFYSDGTHLNVVGTYMIGMTYFATLYKEDPRGLGGYDSYGITDPAVASGIQDAVWDVVSTSTFTGVPEPTTAALGMIALAGLATRRQRRAR